MKYTPVPNDMKKMFREVIVARNTLERMSNANHYRNPFGRKYINALAVDVMCMARKRNKLLPII